MKIWIHIKFWCILLMSIITFGNLYAVELTDICQRTLKKETLFPSDTSQVLLVTHADGFKAKMLLCQRNKNYWQQSRFQKPFAVVVGKNGVINKNLKKEGDQKTPLGRYPIGEAFGFAPLALKMDYRYITSQDKFVDDIKSSQYNTWVVGKTDAKSYESMLINPYKMGAVINYNREPAIPGKGSAIFLHVWRSKNQSTAGCVATDKQHMLAILKWLNKDNNPYIYINSRSKRT